MTKQFGLILGLLSFTACSPIQHGSYIVGEVQADVSSALNAMRLYRNNPDNEGGNENMIFEPSTYFHASEKPNWMNSVNNSYIFIVALIAVDKEFNQSNWSAFFHGLDPGKKDIIKEKIYSTEEREYLQICSLLGAKPFLPYSDFKIKIRRFVLLK